MKKLFIIGLLALATTVSQAQVAARSYKFIPSNISSLIVTNTLQVTNLSSVASAWTTNAAGSTWTNSYGTRVVASTGDKTALLQDAPLWALRDGSGPWNYFTNGLVSVPQSAGTVAINLTSASGANAAVTFVFAPVYGDKESTVATDLWTFSVTPTASTTHTFTTNAPMWLWPGATSLRLRRVVNGDTDATSHVTIRDISLNGFVPVGP